MVTVHSALHQLPDFWKQVALIRIRELMRPGGVLHLTDAVWSFAPEDWYRSIPEWIDRMGDPHGAGFSRADFETHVREEFSSFDWIVEGMLARSWLFHRVGRQSHALVRRIHMLGAAFLAAGACSPARWFLPRIASVAVVAAPRAEGAVGRGPHDWSW